MGFQLPSPQVVQDFFHQQYVPKMMFHTYTASLCHNVHFKHVPSKICSCICSVTLNNSDMDPELPNTGPTNEGAASPSGGKDDIAHIGSICMVYKHLHLANNLWLMQVNIPYMDCLGWLTWALYRTKFDSEQKKTNIVQYIISFVLLGYQESWVA